MTWSISPAEFLLICSICFGVLQSRIIFNGKRVSKKLHANVFFTGNPTEMMITWVTLKPTAHQAVEYNIHGKPLSLNVTSTMTKFTDGGWKHRVLFIHRAKLTGLTPNQAYGRYMVLLHIVTWFLLLKKKKKNRWEQGWCSGKNTRPASTNVAVNSLFRVPYILVFNPGELSLSRPLNPESLLGCRLISLQLLLSLPHSYPARISSHWPYWQGWGAFRL